MGMVMRMIWNIDEDQKIAGALNEARQLLFLVSHLADLFPDLEQMFFVRSVGAFGIPFPVRLKHVEPDFVHLPLRTFSPIRLQDLPQGLGDRAD